MTDRGPVFSFGDEPLRREQRPAAMFPFSRGCMDYDVEDVGEEECQPVFPVRPWAKHQDASIRVGFHWGIRMSGHGDTVSPPKEKVCSFFGENELGGCWPLV